MPSEINNAKTQEKIEDEVSKPTLVVSGNTVDRVRQHGWLWWLTDAQPPTRLLQGC